MAYSHQVTLLADAGFRSRVKIAVFTSVRAVFAQPTPDGRVLQTCHAILADQEAWMDRFMAAVVSETGVATSAASDPTGASISDATLLTVASGTLTALATKTS